MEDSESMEALARQLRLALDNADLSALTELIDPDAHWGAPGDATPPCTNRGQIMAWYQRAKAAGASARVSELDVVGSRLLIELVVRGTREAQQRSGQALRFQVMSTKNGLVTDIVGFDHRDDAQTYAEETTANALASEDGHEV